MATISAVLIKNEKKLDGTWNVKIRVWHEAKSAYIETSHFVSEKQVGKKSKVSESLIIKDNFILDRINPDLKKYRDWISDNSTLVSRLTALQLRDRLLMIDEVLKTPEIDFFGFCQQFIDGKRKSSKASSAKTLATAFNSLKDYFKTDYLPITEINFNFLKKYEEYLTSDRMLKRNNHSGKIRIYTQKGVSAFGLHNHMRDIRLLFNEARNYYNDEDLGEIKIFHYPFKKYKVGNAPLTSHRDRPIAEVKAIRDAILPVGSRAEMARDLCMLSYYLLGMNAADLYELPHADKISGRLNYNRAKTRAKRRDNAFMSVKVINEAKPLLKKYAGQLQLRYSKKDGLNSAIDEGLKVVSKITGIPNIDFYDFRHCVGTFARRQCGFSKDDVAEALNQTDRTVTDTYIRQDWKIIDKIQKSLVALIQ